MTRDAQNLLEIALENKRRELIDEIRSHSADLSISESEADPTDQVQSMMTRDHSAGLVARLSDTLLKVDRSLDAVSDGSYGVCVECDEEIGQLRLKAIPWASHCIRCQQSLEGRESMDFRRATTYRFQQNAA